MRAAQISAYGGKDVVQITEAPKPTIADDQVLVEVHAAAVNPFDWKVREGVAQLPSGFPATLGGDVAGVVAEVGKDATGFTIGQAVFGQANALSGQGSYAEFTPVKASSLASKPLSTDFITAAALPLTSISAYQALVEHLNLQSGQKILIHGGAGGIGSMAIQLAKHLGAYVATTAAPNETDYVKDLGADEVIDYTSQDFSELLKDYDAVYDTIGGEIFTKSFKILKPGSKIVSMAAKADEALDKQYGVTSIGQFTRVTSEKLNHVATSLDQGVLKVHVDKVFPLDQAAEALEYLKTGHPKGKVVIQVKL